MNTQQNNSDDLFDGLNIEGLEDSLITVDVPESEIVAKELSGNPPDNVVGAPEPGKVVEKPPVVKEPDSLIVDELSEEQKAAVTAAAEKAQKDLGGAPDKEDAIESPSYLHAAALQEEGVLPNLDITTLKGKEPKEVFETINKHINAQISESIATGIDQYKNGFGDRAKRLLEALDKGIPLESLEETYSAEDRYGSIKDRDLESNEELQEQVYGDLLSLKGFNPTKIAKMIEKAKEDGELEQESKDGLVEIKGVIEENQKAIEAQAELDKKARDDNNAKIKLDVEKAVTETKEIIPGVTISDNERAALIANMTIPVRYENRNGRQFAVSKAMDIRAKDPLAYEMRLNYFIEKGFFDKSSKFDEIVRKAETSAATKLLKKMEGEPRKSGEPTVKGSEGQKTKEEAFIFPTF